MLQAFLKCYSKFANAYTVSTDKSGSQMLHKKERKDKLWRELPNLRINESYGIEGVFLKMKLCKNVILDLLPGGGTEDPSICIRGASPIFILESGTFTLIALSSSCSMVTGPTPCRDQSDAWRGRWSRVGRWDLEQGRLCSLDDSALLKAHVESGLHGHVQKWSVFLRLPTIPGLRFYLSDG